MRLKTSSNSRPIHGLPPLDPPTLPDATRVIGVGVDLVQISGLAAQISLPGSTYAQAGGAFTSQELRRAQRHAGTKGDASADHLAAVWAIKEAAIKAWSSALENVGRPHPLAAAEIVWAELQVSHTAAGAPRLQLTGRMQRLLDADFPQTQWQVSASHDGDYAVGFAVLSS